MSTTIEQPLMESRAGVLRHGPVTLATDGVDQTNASLGAAHRLALRFREPLHVVTVIEPLPIYGTGDVALPMFMDEVQRGHREADVRRALKVFSLGDDEWSFDMRYGSVARTIAAAARERGSSLIVLAANPHRRLWSAVAGERAAHVLRAADCPVLSVAPNWDGVVRQALVAVDFASPSVRAAQVALDLLEPGGTLTLLHVRPVPDLDNIDGISAAFDRLRTILEAAAPAKVTVEARVLRGGVVERTLELAREISADLIAVGTHGPNVIERLFVGSSATGVLHHAECTVLASPPPGISAALSIGRAMGGVSTTDRAKWTSLLNGVTSRNTGRRVRIEIDDPTFGAQVQGAGLQFRGVVYDARDRRVDVMLNDGVPGARHLTRTIADVDNVALSTRPDGRDEALQIRSGIGSTLVIFAP